MLEPNKYQLGIAGQKDNLLCVSDCYTHENTGVLVILGFVYLLIYLTQIGKPSF